MIYLIGRFFTRISNIIERLKMKYALDSFGKHGKNCHLEGNSSFSSKNIFIGDNVFIGSGATFISSKANIYVGNNVMFGPNVSIVTGNHRTDVIGKYMIDVTEKRKSDDEDVIIEDDCWIAMGATILKGVTIGRGSVIGANALITKSIEPYSVVVSKNENIIRKRFTEEEIKCHEKKLSKKYIGENIDE